MCGYNMKPVTHSTYREEYSWKCIWKKCGWETFQTDNGKLHWKK